MQLGAVLVFDARPLALRHGGVDVERVRAYTAMRLSELPRARARRKRVALGALEVFAEDPSFRLEYHVRHACLPRPGDERALKTLAARVFSQSVDPDKPLWELWIVEGLDGGRFALIAKCDAALLEAGAAPANALEAALRQTVSLAQPANLLARAAGGVRFALDFAEEALAGAQAPLGRYGDGAHVGVDWLALGSADVSAIRARLGGTDRDVVLAALAGGLRRVLERRGADLGALRVVTPICVAGGTAAPRMRLPIGASDPRVRFVTVRAAGDSAPVPAPAAHESPLHELAALSLAAVAGRRADLALHELVSVPGPESLLGACLAAFVPVAPLAPGHALSVTVTRLGNRLHVGLAADAARVPDLPALADAVAASFDELRRLAAEPARASAPRPRRRRAAESHGSVEAR